jgi:hypothetical protein
MALGLSVSGKYFMQGQPRTRQAPRTRRISRWCRQLTHGISGWCGSEQPGTRQLCWGPECKQREQIGILGGKPVPKPPRLREYLPGIDWIVGEVGASELASYPRLEASDTKHASV